MLDPDFILWHQDFSIEEPQIHEQAAQVEPYTEVLIVKAENKLQKTIKNYYKALIKFHKYRAQEDWLPTFFIEEGSMAPSGHAQISETSKKTTEGPGQWTKSKTDMAPHQSGLKQSSAVLAMDPESNPIATYILSRYRHNQDGSLHISVKMKTPGLFIVLFRFLDMFNHMALELTPDFVQVQRMFKGEKINIMKRKGPFFKEFVWNRILLQL